MSAQATKFHEHMPGMDPLKLGGA